MIYLDNAATTAVDPLVFEAMRPYFTTAYGNPGSVHSAGRLAKQAVDIAREQVAKLINARHEEIVFTSGGTESNNLAVKGMSEYLLKTGKKHIVSSASEHASVRAAIDAVCAQPNGFSAMFVPSDEHGVTPVSKVRSAISDRTGLVSVMAVNNETGAVNDVSGVGALCESNGVFFHTDCVQAAPFMELDVRRIGCDMLSISSHKLHGPKGVGALYVGPSVPLFPLISGSTSQESGLRGGTLNVPGIVGFGMACELARRNLDRNASAVMRLKNGFFEGLRTELKAHGIADRVHVNGSRPLSPGGILNLRFDGIDSETLVLCLSARGVCVSAGSACHAQEQTPSLALTSMGLSGEEAFSSVRFSFSHNNEFDEIEQAAKVTAGAVHELSQLS